LRFVVVTLQTMARFIVYACVASLFSAAWSEGLDSDAVDDGILYVGKNMLDRVKTQLERNEDVTNDMMSKLLGFVPDDEIMTPVDVNGVDGDFVSIDVWLRDLGARGTAKALVKAAHFYKASKKKGTETQSPQFVGTLMLEQARDKLAMDEEVTDEDVAKMLGFLPDERSFVALDLSKHGHDISDIDAWLSNQGLKGAAEACVAAARSDDGADVRSPSVLPQEMNVTDSESTLEIQAEEDLQDRLPGAEEEESVEQDEAVIEAVAEAVDEAVSEAVDEVVNEAVDEAVDEAVVQEETVQEEEQAEEPVEESTGLEMEEAPVEDEKSAVAEEQEYVEAELAVVNSTDDSEPDPPRATDTVPQRVRWCALNRGCEQFRGLCCPDTRGRMLSCCAIAEQSPPPAPASLGVPWDNEEGVYFPKLAGSWR